MKRSTGIELLKFSIKKVLKKYGKWFFKMRGNPDYREFALINQRRRSNLGFWTLCAENYCSGFYEQMLLIYYIFAKFCWYDTWSTS